MINLSMLKGLGEYLAQYAGTEPQVEKVKYSGVAYHNGRKYVQYKCLVSYIGNMDIEYAEIITDGYRIKHDEKPEVTPA